MGDSVCPHVYTGRMCAYVCAVCAYFLDIRILICVCV